MGSTSVDGRQTTCTERVSYLLIIDCHAHIYGEDEKKYPYLTKVFDAENEDYEKLRIKVFRIDYDVFKSGKL